MTFGKHARARVQSAKKNKLIFYKKNIQRQQRLSHPEFISTMPPTRKPAAAVAAAAADVPEPTSTVPTKTKAAPKPKPATVVAAAAAAGADGDVAPPTAAASKKRKAPEPKEPKAPKDATATAATAATADGDSVPKEPKEPKEPKTYGPFTTSSIKSLCKTNDVQLNSNVTAILTSFVERVIDKVPTTYLLSTVASLLDVDSPTGVTGNDGVCCNRSYFNKHFVGCKLTKDQKDTVVCNVEIALTSIVTTAIDVTRSLGKKNVQDILVDRLAIGWLLLFGAAVRADTLIPAEVLEQKAVVKARRSDSKKPAAAATSASAAAAAGGSDTDTDGYDEPSDDIAATTATATTA